jgi:hypothetical protein
MKRRRLVLGAILLAAAAAAVLRIWPVHALVLEETRTGRLLFVQRVRPGDGWVTRYTHSVKNKPVWEYFRIDDQYRMVLFKTVFPGSGYGLPCSVAGEENFEIREDGMHVISGMRRIIPRLMLTVAPEYDNVFRYGQDQPLPLSRRIGSGVVDVRIRRTNALNYATQELHHCLKN